MQKSSGLVRILMDWDIIAVQQKYRIQIGGLILGAYLCYLSACLFISLSSSYPSPVGLGREQGASAAPRGGPEREEGWEEGRLEKENTSRDWARNGSPTVHQPATLRGSGIHCLAMHDAWGRWCSWDRACFPSLVMGEAWHRDWTTTC